VRLELDDDELAVCLSGSRALVYPSKYEGFGLPPLEALACGVPVISTLQASLPESVGRLTLPISGHSTAEVSQQLRRAGTPAIRKHFRAEGPRWAASFGWTDLADAFVESAASLLDGGPDSNSSSLVSSVVDSYTAAVRRIQA
jgi:glycosyltransferase involved in cell wall biosynthesis